MKAKFFRLLGCLLFALLGGIFLLLMSKALHLRQNAMHWFGPWGVEGVWLSEDQDLVILSRKKTNDSEGRCDVKMWLLQDDQWLPCQLHYDSSGTAYLFRTDIDIWGDKPFFTSEIRTWIGKIVLKDPKTTIGQDAEEWLRNRKMIVIRRVKPALDPEDQWNDWRGSISGN